MSTATRATGTTGTLQRSPLRPARGPTGSGTIGRVGPLLALLLVAAGLVLGQDALTRARGTGASWVASATTGLDGLAPAGWLVAVGVVLVLVGLWLVVTAFRPRTRDTLTLSGAAGAHLRTGDVARLASAAAADVDGVLAARSSATRRRVVIKVTTTGQAEGADAARTAAEGALVALATPPRVRVVASSPSTREAS